MESGTKRTADYRNRNYPETLDRLPVCEREKCRTSMIETRERHDRGAPFQFVRLCARRALRGKQKHTHRRRLLRRRR